MFCQAGLFSLKGFGFWVGLEAFVDPPEIAVFSLFGKHSLTLYNSIQDLALYHTLVMTDASKMFMLLKIIQLFDHFGG